MILISNYIQLDNQGDTLIAPAAIYAFTVAHPYIAAGAVASVSFVVSLIIKQKEKLLRNSYNLPDQPQLNIEPLLDPEHNRYKLKFTISGSYPERRILLKLGKGLYYGLFDTVIGDRRGSGEIIIDVDLLLQTAKDKNIIDIGLPKLAPGTKELWVYAQEVRPWMGDIRSPITAVYIEVPSIFEEIQSQAAIEYSAITPEDAATRALEGKLNYLKCWIPILSLLPGVLYTPGMWIPWGFIITTKP